MALRLTGSTADAEDVVQDTFLRAFKSLKSFRGDSAVGTWLCRIAINLSRDLYKKKSKIKTKSDSEGESMSPDNLPAPSEGGDTFARKRLEAALAMLPEGYREVLVMHDVMEMGHGEIAKILGTKEGTSKSQLHKARARMREILAAGAA
jgi:RNA polymerase sigma-70 factor (ECF subfamily)